MGSLCKSGVACTDKPEIPTKDGFMSVDLFFFIFPSQVSVDCINTNKDIG